MMSMPAFSFAANRSNVSLVMKSEEKVVMLFWKSTLAHEMVLQTGEEEGKEDENDDRNEVMDDEGHDERLAF